MANPSKKPVNAGLALTQLVGVRDILARLDISRSTLDREREDGNFPAPRLIRGKLRWTADEVEAYSDAQVATHNPPVATHIPEDAFASAMDGLRLPDFISDPAFVDEVLAAKMPAAWVVSDGSEVAVIWPARMGYSKMDVIHAIRDALEAELARRALAGG